MSTPPTVAWPLRRSDGLPVVMGVVNVTPDSFSDGGQWFEPSAAIEHGRELMSQGADIVDVGGESTRPGAERPSVAEERRRVLPVVTALAAAGAVVSVDTMRAEVAADALAAGAAIVNDVSGGMADPEMAGMVAEAGVPFVAMHWRGHSADMQSRAVYGDVVGEVVAELSRRADELVAAGIAADRIVLDPGFGFAKLTGHNWSLLRGLDRLLALDHPILVGTSRKTFLGRIGVPAGGQPRPPLDRDPATAATSMHAARLGAWGVRVHHIPSTLDAMRVARAIQEAQ
ncbi:dihydropteroate synthase [Phycicoccus badiiscoriae]|uniref:Dihydropteroate synthase n=1 Tax=Pedococcus badiiscoriae TaxID=642776 RepID=A0A852WCL8_9MICO|nr:dihydropteroate synthase [Pedococcus badiiscoriae]NYG06539.1 dihydropteroate synthase [Pedococcus badiiscoriae]